VYLLVWIIKYNLHVLIIIVLDSKEENKMVL
jgi:hypothetical protein